MLNASVRSFSDVITDQANGTNISNDQPMSST